MPKTEENEWEYRYKDRPICPYCDHVDQLEDLGCYFEEGEKTIDCESCGKEYFIYTAISFDFSTFTKEE